MHAPFPAAVTVAAHDWQAFVCCRGGRSPQVVCRIVTNRVIAADRRAVRSRGWAGAEQLAANDADDADGPQEHITSCGPSASFCPLDHAAAHRAPYVSGIGNESTGTVAVRTTRSAVAPSSVRSRRPFPCKLITIKSELHSKARLLMRS
jgi:hypothetical protein